MKNTSRDTPNWAEKLAREVLAMHRAGAQMPQAAIDLAEMALAPHGESIRSAIVGRNEIIEECARAAEIVVTPQDNWGARRDGIAAAIRALKNAAPQSAPSAGIHSGEDLPPAVAAPTDKSSAELVCAVCDSPLMGMRFDGRTLSLYCDDVKCGVVQGNDVVAQVNKALQSATQGKSDG